MNAPSAIGDGPVHLGHWLLGMSHCHPESRRHYRTYSVQPLWYHLTLIPITSFNSVPVIAAQTLPFIVHTLIPSFLHFTYLPLSMPSIFVSLLLPSSGYLNYPWKLYINKCVNKPIVFELDKINVPDIELLDRKISAIVGSNETSKSFLVASLWCLASICCETHILNGSPMTLYITLDTYALGSFLTSLSSAGRYPIMDPLL